MAEYYEQQDNFQEFQKDSHRLEDNCCVLVGKNQAREKTWMGILELLREDSGPWNAAEDEAEFHHT